MHFGFGLQFNIDDYTPHHETSTPKGPWPLIIRGIARQRIDSDLGVGDTIERILAKMGGSQFEWVMHRMGIDCGCGSRKDWLNAVYPYTDIPRLL